MLCTFFRQKLIEQVKQCDITLKDSCMKNIIVFFIWKCSVFRGEIFYIFEQACFRNSFAKIKSKKVIAKNYAKKKSLFLLEGNLAFYFECSSKLQIFFFRLSIILLSIILQLQHVITKRYTVICGQWRSWSASASRGRGSGGAKVSCILRHRGVKLISAYSWARPAILVAG